MWKSDINSFFFPLQQRGPIQQYLLGSTQKVVWEVIQSYPGTQLLGRTQRLLTPKTDGPPVCTAQHDTDCVSCKKSQSAVCQIRLFQSMLNHSILNVAKSKGIREEVRRLFPLFMGNYIPTLSQKEEPQGPATVFLFPIQSDIRLILMYLDSKDHSFLFSLLFPMHLSVGMAPVCSPTATHGSPLRKIRR